MTEIIVALIVTSDRDCCIRDFYFNTDFRLFRVGIVSAKHISE